jgi:hypothetical protein
MRNDLTAEYIRLILHYDPSTGIFTWKTGAKIHAKVAGRTAGTPCGKGYRKIKINRVLYFAHRLAWLYMTGRWPEYEIDHKDRNRGNDRFDNLREADAKLQSINRTLGRNNRSGHSGVFFFKRNKRWGAFVRSGKKRKFLGLFQEKDDAIRARQIAVREEYGEF